jgi:hypothetical protein
MIWEVELDDRQGQYDDVQKVFLTISSLKEDDQYRLRGLWLKEMRQNMEFFKKICEQTQRESEIALKGGFIKPGLELWMETRIKKDPSLTPKRVAYECCYYKRVDRKMMPFLIRLAQRVKRRVVMRKRRELTREEGHEKTSFAGP